MAVDIIIPLNGEGLRFARAGCTDPKPLVRVLGREILFWLLDSLREALEMIADDDDDDAKKTEYNIVIAYNAALNAHDFVDRVQQRLAGGGDHNNWTLHFVPLHFNTCGAVETVALALQALLAVPNLVPNLVPNHHEEQDLLQRTALCLDGDVWYPPTTLARILSRLPGHHKRSWIEPENCIIVTRIEEHDDHDNLSSSSSSSSPYSHVVLGEKRKDLITDIVEKVRVSDFACTGVYAFDSSRRLLQSCLELLFSPGTYLQHGEYYMSSLVQYDIQHHKQQYKAMCIPAADVICFGTPAQIQTWLSSGNHFEEQEVDVQMTTTTQQRQQRRQHTTSRGFHKVTIDVEHGVVTKHALTDEATNGLANQVRYYQLVKVKDMFPAILDAAGGWYQMQYIPGKTLAHQYTSQRMTCDDLEEVLRCLQRLHQSLSSPPLFDDAHLYDNYAPKLMHRMRTIVVDTSGLADNVDVLTRRCVAYFEKEYRAKRMGRIGCVHGDPVLSNIIMSDRRHDDDHDNKFIFIDVRASRFSTLDKCERFSMIGDVLYDYAKVYQSLAGYDEILEGTQVASEYRAAMMETLCERVAEVLSPEHVVAMKHAAALLLLSLLPLHPKELWPAFVRLAQHILVVSHIGDEKNDV